MLTIKEAKQIVAALATMHGYNLNNRPVVHLDDVIKILREYIDEAEGEMLINGTKVTIRERIGPEPKHDHDD